MQHAARCVKYTALAVRNMRKSNYGTKTGSRSQIQEDGARCGAIRILKPTPERHTQLLSRLLAASELYLPYEIEARGDHRRSRSLWCKDDARE